MDFTFTPEADEAAALAAQILTDHATTERMTSVERDGDRFDPTLWSALGDAGLLSLALPEADGGAGLGLLEACRVAVEIGRTVAPVPYATHVAASLLISSAEPSTHRDELLSGAADGTRLLTLALAEPLQFLPEVPQVLATPDGESWTLTGTKTLVRAGTRADTVLVTATGPDGAGVFAVRTTDAQVAAQRTSDGDATAQLTLDGCPAVRLGGAGSAQHLQDLAVLLACAEQLGVTQGATRLTADYARTREQFGRPIGTFQAVGQRLADAYIATLGQELTLWQAAWRLQEGLPATQELASAAVWCADAGHTIAHTTVHVHGGVGIDLDGPAHRYFTAAKRWELTYGGAGEHARRIGREYAAG
ncbi:MAG: acyl-CoA dehydrogenase family protein [Nocardioides sp.]|uniref:acyl-CoA dehydrogenase family protein n=1 Tax=Nocardioides sp. TaxID=35761 RepID=UPI003F0679C6